MEAGGGDERKNYDLKKGNKEVMTENINTVYSVYKKHVRPRTRYDWDSPWQRVLNDFYRTRLPRRCMIWLLHHPFPLSSVSKLYLFLRLPVCRRLSLLKGEGFGKRDGGGLYDDEKGRSSINHSTLSGPGERRGTQNKEKMSLCLVRFFTLENFIWNAVSMQSKTHLKTTAYFRSATLSRNIVPPSISPRNPSCENPPPPWMKRLSAMQFPTGVGRGGGMSQIYHGTAPLSPLPSHFTLIPYSTTLISYHSNLSPFLAITISSPSFCFLRLLLLVSLYLRHNALLLQVKNSKLLRYTLPRGKFKLNLRYTL